MQHLQERDLWFSIGLELTWAHVGGQAGVSTHPDLRSVIRRQLVESRPTRPLRTTLDSRGRSSGEMRFSATSGDKLFIFRLWISVSSPTKIKREWLDLQENCTDIHWGWLQKAYRDFLGAGSVFLQGQSISITLKLLQWVTDTTHNTGAVHLPNTDFNY